VYGRALAQTVGTAVLRLADAEVLPYEFTGAAATVGRYVKEVEKLLQDEQEATAERNRELEEGVFAATADPWQRSVAPPRQDLPPHLDFAPLENALDALNRAAERYEKAFTRAQSGGTTFAQPGAAGINPTLIRTERALTIADGLPRRPWFRHAIYAPGFYTGYGVKTLPGVREAIEQRNWKEADAEIVSAAGALTAEAEVLDHAAVQMEQLVH
jgi:N-acetylated-alpha-linked acidic dipeptidase